MSQKNQNEHHYSRQDVLSVDIVELVYWLVDHFKRILAAMLIGALIMTFYSFVLAKPVYQATSMLYVLNSSDSAINLSDLQIGAYLTSDYQEVFETWEVKEMVLQKLNLDYTYDELDDMLEINNPTNTRMLHITVSSTDPKEAMEMANTYAEVTSKYISETMLTDPPSIMSHALIPEEPMLPRKKLNIFIGALAGAVLMMFILMVQYILDDKLKTTDDVMRYLQVPVLAVVPTNKRKALKRKMGKGEKQQV